MSKKNTVKINCPYCGAEGKCDYWTSVNATIDRRLKALLLDSRLNVTKCRKCGRELIIESEILYHDMKKEVMIEFLPAKDVSDRIERFMRIQKVMDPVRMIKPGSRYRLRYVWDRNQLMEKIRIFDADLDDRVMEVFKYGLSQSRGEGLGTTEPDALYFLSHDKARDLMLLERVRQDKKETISVLAAFYRDFVRLMAVEDEEYLKWMIVDGEYGRQLFSRIRPENPSRRVEARPAPSWQGVYADSEKTIELDPREVILDTQGIVQVTVRWKFLQPRELKRTKGVYYQSRIECMHLDPARGLFKTLQADLFDQAGQKIEFDRVVPSGVWDPITRGSLIEVVLRSASAILQSRMK